MTRYVTGLVLAALCAQSAPAVAAAHPAQAAKTERAAGGAQQMKAAEGCMNTWLFNGVWRLRVKSVVPITDGSWAGFGVNAEFRNGTRKTIELGNTGVQGRGTGVQLIMDDGNALTLNDLDYQNLGYKDVVQGGTASWQLKYHFASGANTSAKPAKFIVEIDPHQSTKAHYTLHDPSFRVNLTCGQ